jgi:HPt (histidine-containing phosphotransfer) domain-containing protein
MTADPTAVLAGLRQRFLRRAAGDLDQLRAWRDGFFDKDALYLLVHRLHGAAGTFGFPTVSAAAAAAEADWRERGHPGETTMQALIAELEALPAEDSLG